MQGRDKDTNLQQLAEELETTKGRLVEVSSAPQAAEQAGIVSNFEWQAMGDVEAKMGSIGKTREELEDVQVVEEETDGCFHDNRDDRYIQEKLRQAQVKVTEH